MLRSEIAPDKLMSLLIGMIDDVREMVVRYEHFPSIIEREFDLIRSGNYDELDKVVAEKVANAETIETHYDSLNFSARNLLECYKAVTECDESSVRDLSHCAEMFEWF